MGDVVGFLDRQHQQRTGKVVRLNDKTVTLQCDRAQWRVGYSHLHRVFEVGGVAREVFELGQHAGTKGLIGPIVSAKITSAAHSEKRPLRCRVK